MDHGERLVLGDELQAAGDPRSRFLGELVAVQAALELTSGDDGLYLRERALIRENEEAWFGDLAPMMRRDGRVEYGWRQGFLDSVVLRTLNRRFLRELTAAPAARFLRRVLIDLRDANTTERTVDHWLVELRTPNLEELEIRPHGQMDGLFTAVMEKAAMWPKLRTLKLWSTARDENLDRLEGLLDGGTIAGVEHLALHRLPNANRALEVIAASNLLGKLRTLDVSHGYANAMNRFDRYAHLEKLNLHDNRFHPDAAKQMKAQLGDRVEIGNQYFMGNDGALRARFEEVLRRAAADERAAMEMIPNELAVPEAIPFLTLSLDSRAESRWVLLALAHLARAAGPLASDALALRNLHSTLAYVDPERACGLGLHEERDHRTILCRELRSEPARHGAHLRRLLESDDPDVVRFALDGNNISDASFLSELARAHPEAVPAYAIRPHLEHEEAAIRDAAAARLAELHFPEDAERVIAHVARGGFVQPPFTSWLGSHPRSHELIHARSSQFELFDIVRRRRCAGLTTDEALVRPLLLAAIDRNYAHSRDRERAIELAARTAAELRLHDFTPTTPIPVSTLERADELFDAGDVEGAFDHYANILWHDPACARAASRIASIERANGSVITQERIDWLRSLGAGVTIARQPA